MKKKNVDDDLDVGIVGSSLSHGYDIELVDDDGVVVHPLLLSMLS